MPGLRLDVGMKPRNLSFERRGARGDTSEAEMRRRGRQSKPRESAGRCLARLCSPLAALWRASGARGTEGCGESPPRLGRRRLAKCETVAGAAAAAVAQRAVHEDSLTRPVRDMSVDASRTWPADAPQRTASSSCIGAAHSSKPTGLVPLCPPSPPSPPSSPPLPSPTPRAKGCGC